MYPGKALSIIPSSIRFPIRYSVPSPEGNASGRGDAESDILINDQRDAGLKQKNVTTILSRHMQRLIQSEAFPIYDSFKDDDVNRFTDKIDPVKICQ